MREDGLDVGHEATRHGMAQQAVFASWRMVSGRLAMILIAGGSAVADYRKRIECMVLHRESERRRHHLQPEAEEADDRRYAVAL